MKTVINTVIKENAKANSTDQVVECSSDEVYKLILAARKYHDDNKLMQANYLYQQILHLETDNISALNGLAMIAMDAGMLSLAMELFNFALLKSPNNLSLSNNVALVYSRMGEFTAAIEKYTEILQQDETSGDVHGELARLYLQTGDLAQAITHFHLAFTLNPSDPRNFHGLVQLDAEAITLENIDTVESILSKTDLPLADRRSFYFALGAIYDASERYDEAFANYAVANMSKAARFDANKYVSYITNVINTFTPELFHKFNQFELCPSQQPVFIIGMPRSGTTLVEQVLGNHTDIYAGGELNLINEIAHKLKLTIEQVDNKVMSFNFHSAETLSGYARYYLNDVNNLALNKTHNRPLRITDKMPTNFIYLGLIALLFPNAQVIHCRRNPLDVSLSCYFHDFAGDHGYACDLKDIGLYYKQYERLMDHWKKVLPMKIHTVEYEEMVKQPEVLAKQIIKFVDLDWQQECTQINKVKHHLDEQLPLSENDECSLPMQYSYYYDKFLQPLRLALSESNNSDVV